MAILQALFALISRSLGKILSSAFGWAVNALFGRTSPKENTILSGVVAMAAAWPLLLVGTIFPKLAALVLALVPIPKWVPSWPIRLAWIALALAVPVIVGSVIAANGSSRIRAESFSKKVLRGFPITLGLAGSFLMLLVITPVVKLVALVRRQTDEHVRLMAKPAVYHQLAVDAARTLRGHGLMIKRATPPWWISAPSNLLLRMGGKVFERYIPEELEYWQMPGSPSSLTLAYYPTGLLLRGTSDCTARAHGLVVEMLAKAPVLETTDPAAQEVEEKLKRIWDVYRSRGSETRAPKALLRRLERVSRDIEQLHVPYEDWQIVFRQALQLYRALRGEKPLLEKADRAKLDHPVKSLRNATLLAGTAWLLG